MQVIQLAGIRHVDCAALFSPMSPSYQSECKRITSLMMSQQLYDEARKFAGISGTPADHITLEQVRYWCSELKCITSLMISQQVYYETRNFTGISRT